jgi:hypothetical protein
VAFWIGIGLMILLAPILVPIGAVLWLIRRLRRR